MSDDLTPGQKSYRRGLQVMDEEADLFAVELLMPKALLLEDIRKLGGIDIETDHRIESLAKRYRVSLQLMTMRLGQLLLGGR